MAIIVVICLVYLPGDILTVCRGKLSNVTHLTAQTNVDPFPFKLCGHSPAWKPLPPWTDGNSEATSFVTYLRPLTQSLQVQVCRLCKEKSLGFSDTNLDNIFDPADIQ